METKNNDETFSFDFKNLKFDASKPGKQTTINLIVLLIFFLAAAVLLAIFLKEYIIPVLMAAKGRKLLSFFTSVLEQLKGRSP